MKGELEKIFKRLYFVFGPQHWWPAQSAFEVIVGAILTQNTSWSNVEKAVAVLRKNKLLNARRMQRMPVRRLAGLIKSSGYYNIKAARLKSFLEFFSRHYSAKLGDLAGQEPAVLRKQLLAVKGIGPETCDSILLYALGKPVFVVDAYTKRILSRHGLAKEDAPYREVQDIFMRNLKPDVKLFNEYHALLVKLGKDYCRKQNPKCEICPLRSIKKD